MHEYDNGFVLAFITGKVLAIHTHTYKNRRLIFCVLISLLFCNS